MTKTDQQYCMQRESTIECLTD